MTWRLRPFTFLPASEPRGPPLSVVFTLWLSSTTAVGEASRPTRSRSAMTRWWLIRPNSPSSRQRLSGLHALAVEHDGCGRGFPADSLAGRHDQMVGDPAGQPFAAPPPEVATGLGCGRPVL